MNRTNVRRVELLLKLRRHREEGAKRAFMEARRGMETTVTLIEALDKVRNAHNSAARSALLVGPGPAGLGGYRRATCEINMALAQHRRRLVAALAELDRRRAELVAARKQRRAMQLLAGRLAEQAVVRQGRLETKAADDLYASGLAVAGRQPAATGTMTSA